jgi:hypothetical protein
MDPGVFTLTISSVTDTIGRELLHRPPYRTSLLTAAGRTEKLLMTVSQQNGEKFEKIGVAFVRLDVAMCSSSRGQRNNKRRLSG